MKAWIGLGSNIGDGPQQLDKGLSLLREQPHIKVLRQSGYYRTAPWGFEEQDDFTNGVAEIETELPALELLDLLLAIELEMGRKRTGRQWGPRVIDLDLLSYDDRILHLPRLELPHPCMHLRAFVLRPLVELEPDFIIPGKGSARDYLAEMAVHESVHDTTTN